MYMSDKIKINLGILTHFCQLQPKNNLKAPLRAKARSAVSGNSSACRLKKSYGPLPAQPWISLPLKLIRPSSVLPDPLTAQIISFCLLRARSAKHPSRMLNCKHSCMLVNNSNTILCLCFIMKGTLLAFLLSV